MMKINIIIIINIINIITNIHININIIIITPSSTTVLVPTTNTVGNILLGCPSFPRCTLPTGSLDQI